MLMLNYVPPLIFNNLLNLAVKIMRNITSFNGQLRLLMRDQFRPIYSQKQQQSIRQRSPSAVDEEANAHKR